MYSKACQDWVLTLHVASLVFCQVSPDDPIVPTIARVVPVSLRDINASVTSLQHQPHSSNPLHFVFFVDTRKVLSVETCVSKSLPYRDLNHHSRVIVCDQASEMPTVFKYEAMEGLVMQFHYLTLSECWSLSPFYLFHRYFSRVKCKRVPRVWDAKPDMKGQIVPVITYRKLLYTIIKVNEIDTQKRYDGVEMRIFFNIAEILNMSWKITEVDRNYNVYGEVLDGKWVGGVIGALVDGKAEIALIAKWIDGHMTEFIDISVPWTNVDQVLLVPRPKLLQASWKTLLRPFKASVWIAFAVSVLVTSVIAWVASSNYKTLAQAPLVYYLLNTLGALLNASGHIYSRVSSHTLRIVLVWWSLVSMIFYTGYSCRIASMLTMPYYSPRLDNMRQVVEANVTWGKPLLVKGQYIFNKEDYWQRRFMEHIVLLNKSNERELLSSGKFAVYGQVMDPTTVMMHPLLDDNLTSAYRLMRKPIKVVACATALRKRSLLTPVYDKVLVDLLEKGVVVAIKKHVVHKYQRRSYDGLWENPDPELSTISVIKIVSFMSVMYLLAIGWGVSFMCFIMELLVYKLQHEGKRFAGR